MSLIRLATHKLWWLWARVRLWHEGRPYRKSERYVFPLESKVGSVTKKLNEQRNVSNLRSLLRKKTLHESRFDLSVGSKAARTGVVVKRRLKTRRTVVHGIFNYRRARPVDSRLLNSFRFFRRYRRIHEVRFFFAQTPRSFKLIAIDVCSIAILPSADPP